jgi:modulator of FtsH protease
MRPESSLTARRPAVAMNEVLRKTYLLLSMTLLFSAATAGFAVIKNVSYINPIITLVGFFGLYFITMALRNSPLGILSIFAFTGFTGYTLGPILNSYIHGFSNGAELVGVSLASTGFIFMALSGYVLVTKKDFSFMGGFLFVALLVGIAASLGGIVFNIPMLYMASSAAFVLIASGMILFDTSRILQGGETNYIMATIQLYMDIYILFINLLQILGMFGGRRD